MAQCYSFYMEFEPSSQGFTLHLQWILITVKYQNFMLLISPSFLVLLIWIIAVKKIIWRAQKSLGLVCCKFKVKKRIKITGLFLAISHNLKT